MDINFITELDNNCIWKRGNKMGANQLYSCGELNKEKEKEIEIERAKLTSQTNQYQANQISTQ